MGAEFVVGSEALATGITTRRELARMYVKVHQNVYVRRGIPLTPIDRARAAWLWSGRRATLVGHSAAAMLGSKWIPDDAPVEIGRIRRPGARGIRVRSGVIRDDEVCRVDGIRCTTAERTAYDLGRQLPLDTAIARIDALLNATGCAKDRVEVLTARYSGARGIRRLRYALALVDAGAESPQETRTRLLLVSAGLTPIVTQIAIPNRWGRVRVRIDMGWPEYLVGVEYDGEQHWTDPEQFAKDIERLEFLANAGWLIVRVSARQLRYDPAGVVERARRALSSRGYDADGTVIRGVTRSRFVYNNRALGVGLVVCPGIS
jgi:hypothetical protein